MAAGPIDFTKTALLIVDLQNDFIDPKGAYGRAGQTAAMIAELPARLKPLADALRAKGGFVLSTQFTLVPGRGGEPMISPHLKELRPFLKKGDFQPGAWGHQLADILQPADFVVEKVAYSAFFQSRMEFVLKKAGIETLFVCGIVTNGGVASTARDAHVRDFRTFVLSDGCGAFSQATHDNAIRDLSTVTKAITVAEAIAMVEGA
jgi:nicotinamidase-related amidase